LIRRDGPLRVLIITPDFPPARGGIQTLMGNLAANLPRARVRVLTIETEGAEEADRVSGLDVRRARLGVSVPKLRIALLSARSIIEALRFRPRAVVLGHVAVAPAGAVISRLLRVPTVLYVHADEFRAWPLRCAFGVRRAAMVVAVSRHAAEMAMASGARAGRLRIIAPGVERPQLPTGRGAPGQRPTALTIARLNQRHKGHDVMLRAMTLVLRRVPDARWVVIGDGPLRPALEGLAEELGVASAVEFVGPVSDQERDDWLRRADVFVMPSRLPPGGVGGEGFGIVYLEAAAHGLPVVAGSEGGSVDAVDAGRSALLVDPHDHVAVANAVATLLESPERARSMGSAGYEWAGRFSWQASAAALEGVLRSAAGAV
jgi:phosphatidylinositol alpha-1,6-mannosyltransferase